MNSICDPNRRPITHTSVHMTGRQPSIHVTQHNSEHTSININQALTLHFENTAEALVFVDTLVAAAAPYRATFNPAKADRMLEGRGF